MRAYLSIAFGYTNKHALPFSSLLNPCCTSLCETGHPIRQAHELINVLKSGRIGANDEGLSFWLGDEFQTADLTAYLGPGSIADDQLAALDARQWHYSMGSRDLVFSSYILDMLKLDRELRERHGRQCIKVT